MNHQSAEVEKPGGYRDRNLEKERSGQEMCSRKSSTPRGKGNHGVEEAAEGGRMGVEGKAWR